MDDRVGVCILAAILRFKVQLEVLVLPVPGLLVQNLGVVLSLREGSFCLGVQFGRRREEEQRKVQQETDGCAADHITNNRRVCPRSRVGDRMGDMYGWLAQNWFDLCSPVGIIGSLIFTAISLRSETRIRKIENLLTITSHHRELWIELLASPALKRVLDPMPDLPAPPVNLEEAMFVNLVIQHVNSVFQAMKDGLAVSPENLSRDVSSVFSLPIPKAVWGGQLRLLQDHDFVEFVERALEVKGGTWNPSDSSEVDSARCA